VRDDQVETTMGTLWTGVWKVHRESGKTDEQILEEIKERLRRIVD
jgi:hypothetical protein